MQKNPAKLRKLTAIGWQGRLAEASTPESVVDVVQEFVAGIGAAERDQLPDDCRPGAMGNVQQVIVFAMKLVHRHDGDPKSAPMLHRMTTFFTRAALRVYQIQERSHEVAAERRPARKVAGNG